MMVGDRAVDARPALADQLSADSGYLSVLGPLVLVGLGNGSAFVPLTGAALQGVQPQHAGAASGLVNVMQQVGAALGLAILVTVFGSASRDAASSMPSGSSAAEQAQYVFVSGAHDAFLVATACCCSRRCPWCPWRSDAERCRSPDDACTKDPSLGSPWPPRARIFRVWQKLAVGAPGWPVAG